MGCYVICPNRESRKVSLEVCLRACELKHECDEFKEVPRADMEAAAAKLGIPLRSLRELEPVVDVDAEMKYERTEAPRRGDGNERNLSFTGCGKSPETARDDAGIQAEGADVFCKTAPNAEVMNPGDIQAKKAMELYKKLLVLKEDIGAKFVEIGDVLNEFYDHKYYFDVGYTDWGQFCAEALDFSAQWALEIRKIALKKNQLKLSDRDVAAVGVKKMAQLLPVMTDRRSADHWMKEAKKPGVTTERLVAKVRHARGRITKDEAEKVPSKLIYSVWEEQLETIERAHELAKDVAQSDSRGVQLEAIAGEFCATYEHESGDFNKVRIVTGWLRRLESLMKVRVTGDVICVETGEIIREGAGK